MKENELANLFLRAITKHYDEGGNFTQQSIWELSNKLAKLAQPRKSYQDLYNSPEGRKERQQIINKQQK